MWIYSDRCVQLISQAIYQSFTARENVYLRRKLFVYGCFIWFFLHADATATYITLYLKELLSIYSAVSSHSKEGVGCAMMLMLRRVGVWTGDWL